MQTTTRFQALWTRGLPIVLALAALALAGCTPAPSCPPQICHQTTVFPQSDFAHRIQDLYVLLFWLSVVVCVLVEGALVYALIRFRSRPTDATRPAQIHGNTLLEIGWTIAPAIVLVIITVPTLQLIFEMGGDPPPNSLQVEVIGHQWWWEVRYPDSHVVTANEVHVPANRPVVFHLRSIDVIHSFWIPMMGGKVDVLPGTLNKLFFTPMAPGEYWGQCVEYCGTQHANMRFRLIVDPPATFEAWLRVQQQPAAQSMTTEAQTGAQVFLRAGCIACHTIEGTVAQGIIGPNLTHFGSRSTVGAGILDNTPANVQLWVRDPQAIKPGNAMPNLHLRHDDLQAVAAYLGSLR